MAGVVFQPFFRAAGGKGHGCRPWLLLCLIQLVTSKKKECYDGKGAECRKDERSHETAPE